MLWQCFLVAISCYAFWHLLLSLYRITFHPLARYPGPWLAKVTDLYGAYHNARGQLHLKTWEGHRRWGKIVRHGPNKVVFNSVTALHEIYHSKHVQKSKGYIAILPAPGAYSTFTSVDESMHRRKRKVISQGLSEQAMRSFEPTMLRHVDVFLKGLMQSTRVGDGGSGNEWSTPIDMTDRCKHLGYDIMGEFGFGRSFEMQTKSENHFILDAIAANILRAGVFQQFPALAKFGLVMPLLYPKVVRLRQKFMQVTTDLVETRLSADKNSQHDLFSFIVDAKDPETGQGFSNKEIWAESRLLLIAGSDTSATALSAAFFYLSRYPDCYRKLVSEIRSVFSSGRDIRSGAKLSQCQYLRACIDEAMRMTPPVGGTLWREVRPGGIIIDDEFIPAGCDVGCSSYAVHHNEDYFPDSFTFKPERWILSPDNPKEAIDRARSAFSAFSLGPQGCAGRTMAYMEVSDALAKTVWYLDFRRPEGRLGLVGEGAEGLRNGRNRAKEFQLEDHLTSLYTGPFVEVRRREEFWKELFSE